MTNEESIKYGKGQLEIFGGKHREFLITAIIALEKAKQIEDAAQTICDDFCRYPREYNEEQEGECLADKYCEACPLGKL